MYLNRAAKKELAQMISGLAEIGCLRDIDTSVMLAEQIASKCGINPDDIPGIAEMRKY